MPRTAEGDVAASTDMDTDMDAVDVGTATAVEQAAQPREVTRPAAAQPAVRREPGAPAVRSPSLVGTLDGRLMQFPCADSPITDDCSGLGYVVDGVVTTCVGGRSEMALDHPIGGTPGARYLVTMHFYGIMKSKNLGGAVTRDAGVTRPNLNGGPPFSWATAPAGTNYRPIGLQRVRNPRPRPERPRDRAVLPEFQRRRGPLDDSHRLRKVHRSRRRRFRSFEAFRPQLSIDQKLRHDARLPLRRQGAKHRPRRQSAAAPPWKLRERRLQSAGLNKDANNGGQWWMIDVTAVSEL